MSFRRTSYPRETKFIHLSSRRCKGCWDCIDVCPQDVLGQFQMGWHSHAIIKNAKACNGCKKCVRACKYSALEYIYMPHTNTEIPDQASVSR